MNNESLINASCSHLYYQFSRDRSTRLAHLSKVRQFLLDRGFSKTSDANLLIGKVLAFAVGTFHYDFIMYPVSGMSVSPLGYNVKQDGNTVIFGNQTNNSVDTIRRQDLELFVPQYFFDIGEVYVGDKIPDSVSADENKLGWKYPPKKYITEQELVVKEPELYKKIVEKINASRLGNTELNNLEQSIVNLARKSGIIVTTESRVKTPVGIYSSLQRRVPERDSPDKIYDINGIRVLANTPDECYGVLEIIHEKLMEICFFRDWIAVPKPNGFQGLLAIPSKDIDLEFQVQTSKMKMTAETGSASNYRIK